MLTVIKTRLTFESKYGKYSLLVLTAAIPDNSQ